MLPPLTWCTVACAAAPAVATDQIQAESAMVMTLARMMIAAQRRFLALCFIVSPAATKVLGAVARLTREPCFFLV